MFCIFYIDHQKYRFFAARGQVFEPLIPYNQWLQSSTYTRTHVYKTILTPIPDGYLYPLCIR
jgi:hypothetical protein